MTKNEDQANLPTQQSLEDLQREIVPSSTVKKVLSLSNKLTGEFRIRYETALDLVVAKLNFIDRGYELENDVTLIDSLQHRIKSPESIVGKLERKHLNVGTEAIFDQIQDIAGVRVITKFVSDIQTIRDLIAGQPDMAIVKEKDYVNNPKENGYRSLHLIVKVPIYLSNGKEMIPVEIQIRTVGMNFWASLEHELNYKQDVQDKEQLKTELKQKAIDIIQLDEDMDMLRHKIRKPR